MKKQSKRAGFTLIELSVVLVIIGLLVGAVVAGQSLIRSTELKAIAVEFATYQKAVKQFQETYYALPGDLPNAETVWGTATNCPGNSAQGSTDVRTCNGDGDGVIDSSTRSHEMYRFWQHLANARLIDGRYSGVPGSGTVTDHRNGVNCPSSALKRAGWSVFSDDGTVAANDIYTGFRYVNAFSYGKNLTDDITQDAVLSPEEAWSIDSKIDDAFPNTGKVMAGGIAQGASFIGTCTNAGGTAYLRTTKATNCAFHFPNAF